jgi:hypothetical protein
VSKLPDTGAEQLDPDPNSREAEPVPGAARVYHNLAKAEVPPWEVAREQPWKEDGPEEASNG